MSGESECWLSRSATLRNHHSMSGKSLQLAVIPLQTRRAESDDDEEGDLDDTQTPRNSQIVSFSAFKLPDDWVVEERPRQTVNSGRRFDRVSYSLLYRQMLYAFICHFFPQMHIQLCANTFVSMHVCIKARIIVHLHCSLSLSVGVFRGRRCETC